MNRRLQIMHILRDNGGTMKTGEIARIASTSGQNIHKVLLAMAEEGLIAQVGERPLTYQINDAGRAWLALPEVTAAKLKQLAHSTTNLTGSREMKVGVFTTGEIQIEVGGKRVLLSRDQSADLVEFLDALPGKIFEKTAKPAERANPFAALGVTASRVHRIADSD